MKNSKLNKKFSRLIVGLSITAALLLPLGIEKSWCSMDYNGDGIVTGAEKERYCQEVWGTSDPDELEKTLNERYGSGSSDTTAEISGGNSYSDPVSTEAPKTEVKKEEPKHTHSYTAEVTTEPTCVKEGVLTYKCSCGDSYTESIPMKEHNFEEKITREPTCDSVGIETRYCTVCALEEPAEIPALDHQLGDWVVVKEATCLEEGKNARYCTVCNKEVETMVTDKLEHKDGEWTVVKGATMLSTGTKVLTCAVGGEVLAEEVIPANTWQLIVLICVAVAAIAAVVGVVVFKKKH